MVPAKHLTHLLLLPMTFLSLAYPTSGTAQSEIPVIVSGGLHALTVPWYPSPVTNGRNPAFMVGTDRTWKAGDNWRLSFGVNLGFVRHRWWMTGISLEPEVGISGIIHGGFHGGLHVGLGYMHYFWRRKSLELKDGRYVEAADWGRPSMTLPLSVTLGFRGISARPLTAAPFVTARWVPQGMFLDEIPVTTHFLLMGGFRIQRRHQNTNEGR